MHIYALQWKLAKIPRGWGFFRLLNEASPKKPHHTFLLFSDWESHLKITKVKMVGLFFRFPNEAIPKKAPSPWGFSRVSTVYAHQNVHFFPHIRRQFRIYLIKFPKKITLRAFLNIFFQISLK